MHEIDELIRTLYDPTGSEDLIEDAALTRARTALRSAVAEQAGAPARRRMPTAPRRRALAVGLATIAILLVGALMPVWAGHGPAGVPVGSPAPASAQTALASAARAVSRQPWRPLGRGEWGYFRFVESFPGAGRPATNPTLIDHDWIAAGGGARFVQPTDVLLWGATPAEVASERARQRRGSHLFVESMSEPWTQFGLSYEQIIHLPTQPAKLARFIRRHAFGHSTAMTVTYASQLIREPFLPPRLTAAFYRVIATLPGIELVGRVVDPLGRSGIAVSLVSGAGERTELIFDPHTGVLLSEEVVATRTSGGHPAGTVTAWSGMDDQSVVGSNHTLPTGSAPATARPTPVTTPSLCGRISGTVVITARHLACGQARAVAAAYLRGVARPDNFRCQRHSITIANGWWASCTRGKAYVQITPE